MCYGYGCGHEDAMGQCRRGRGVECPAVADHGAGEEEHEEAKKGEGEE